MVSIETYREKIQEILREYSTHQPAYGDVEMELIFDRERDRYQLVCTAWSQKRRIYGSLIGSINWGDDRFLEEMTLLKKFILPVPVAIG